MCEINFLYTSAHTKRPSEFKPTKTQGNSESLPESLLLISMCHQHLCKERWMTGTSQVQQLSRQSQYELSVNSRSQGEEGG